MIPGSLAQTVFRLVMLVIGLVAVTGCAGKEPILIGFAGELTGLRGGLGVAARDGAQLAVDEINARGGIQGRPIELMVRDDKGEPETARQIDAELAEQGVAAIIGHITSGQTAAVFDQINEAEIVLLSPTSASSLFSGQKDYFFRVMPDNNLNGKGLALHMFQTRHVRRLTGVYDLNNRIFADTLWQAIQAEFEKLGGDAGQVVTFKSGETDLKTLIAQVKDTRPEAVVFIASAVDTALLMQYGKQQGLDAQFFSSTWAQTDELLEKGGRAVEGLEMSAAYDPDNPFPAYQQFVDQFEARYHRQPGLAASHAYEAVQVLAEALEKTEGTAAGLPEALITVKNLEGVHGTVSMDEFGDVKRDVHIAVVRNGRFEIINTNSPF